MTQTQPKNDAPARSRDATPDADISISSVLSAKELKETYGEVPKLGEKSKPSDGFVFADLNTWGDIYGRGGELARALRGEAFASGFNQFARSVDGGLEASGAQDVQHRKDKTQIATADGKVGDSKVEGKTKISDTTAVEKTKIDDRTGQPELTRESVLKDYSETLKRAGFSETDAQRISENTYARLQKAGAEGHLKGSPEEQMKRMDTAHREILDKQQGGRLRDGQTDYLTNADRQNIVKDSALRTENPDKYVNQGQHMTCALHSMGKQELEAGDPAKVAERTRDLVNNGFTTAKEQDRKGPNGEIIPGKERVVQVDSLSLKPDFEASRTVNSQNYGDNGKQGPAGQVYAAFAGQLAADLKSEREGGRTSAEGIHNASNVYMAAHAGERGARSSQTSTNEGVFSRDSQGKLHYEGDGPQVGIWDVAHLNKANGGADGAVFASASLFRDGKGLTPPAGYPADLKISTFKNTDELRQKLGEFQRETGQSGQIGVNAPFLPGGGRNGHGMHAMNISLNADGSFKLDNNWGSNKDLARVSDRDVDIATNKENWQVPGGGGGRVPDDGTRFGPSTGRNPNETEKEFEKRKEDEKKKQEEEEKIKERERLEQQKLKAQLESLERQANLEYIQALAQFQQAEERAKTTGIPNTMPKPVQMHYV